MFLLEMQDLPETYNILLVEWKLTLMVLPYKEVY
jgi:hypothetical protein